MGADVSVVARKNEELAFARFYGCKCYNLHHIVDAVKNQDIIFNTVPYPIIDQKVIKHLNKEILIIDLASAPGGIDFQAAEKVGIKTIWALGLPGKVAPKTAGYIIKDVIIKMLESNFK